jgi:hypothetical protein
MVFNATFNNNSVISWWSFLFVKETGVPEWTLRDFGQAQFITTCIFWKSHWKNVNPTSCYNRYHFLHKNILSWWYALIAQVVVNPTTIRSWPWQPLNQHLPFSKVWTLQEHDNSFNTLKDKFWYNVFVCQWLTTGRWFSPGTPVSFTNKNDHHDITEL